MTVKAIMWDGMNKLHGELILDEKSLQFRLIDFSESDLKMNLQLSEVDEVTYEAVFGLDLKALKILTVKGKRNLFILDNPTEFKSIIIQKKRKLNTA